jgi:Barrel-sandwich domain of CusB or HlyD membrane-fusion
MTAVQDGEVPIGAGQLATLCQLAARARDAASEQTLAFVIVNETLALTPYRQAALWRGPAPGAVAAVSGLPQSDPNAPYIQWLASLCRALAREGAKEAAGTVLSGARTFTAADVAPALAAEWETWLPAHAVWLPLTTRTGMPLGGLLFAREELWTPAELALLSELTRIWAHAFAAFHPRPSWAARAGALLRGGPRQRRALAVLAIVCVLPVRLAVLAPAEVTAKDPFVVRAPLDGVIDRLYVQPNQAVAQGTLLLALDSTTLQSHYALARKDLDAAQEEYRQTAQLAVTQDKDRLDMALRKGKLDESQIELAFTAQQLARVRVAAPRAGVAVFADANDWTGKAVAVGEKVMLLADPASVELTVYLPVADNVDVKAGDTLTLFPKSSPLSTYAARIDSVAYRAEPTSEGVLAYRLKASFVGAVRPALGTMGTARTHGHRVPLIYYLLRRPLTLARQWLGW